MNNKATGYCDGWRVPFHAYNGVVWELKDQYGDSFRLCRSCKERYDQDQLAPNSNPDAQTTLDRNPIIVHGRPVYLFVGQRLDGEVGREEIVAIDAEKNSVTLQTGSDGYKQIYSYTFRQIKLLLECGILKSKQEDRAAEAHLDNAIEILKKARAGHFVGLSPAQANAVISRLALIDVIEEVYGKEIWNE